MPRCRTRLDPRLTRAQLLELGLSHAQVDQLQDVTTRIYNTAAELERLGATVEVTLNINFPLRHER